jgi:hypothetical protein
VVVAAVVVGVTLGSSGGGSGSKSPVQFTTSSGVQVYGSLGPENVPLQVGVPLAPANVGLTGATIEGVGCSASEQVAYHHHVHLAIFVNGQPRSVPLAVGMVPPAVVEQTSQGEYAVGSNTCIYWLHTHAQDGIVHIESPNPANFTLGQFFAVWMQPLSATRIGPYQGTVTATVNGAAWRADPATIPLEQHDQIVLNLGGPAVVPPPIDWSITQL